MSSSSGEEDGDAVWKAAIDSVSSSVSFSSSATTALNRSFPPPPHHRPKSQSHLKHYQIKAQQMLNDILENTIQVVVVSSSIPFPFPCEEEEEDSADNGGGGIQLFKHAPSGIVFDHIDEVQQPNKKPRLLPGKEIDEKSKKFKQHLQSVVVDGIDIIAAARDAAQKSLARLEAREVVAKEAAKREEERVAELKKIRGERWLPCMPPKGGYF